VLIGPSGDPGAKATPAVFGLEIVALALFMGKDGVRGVSAGKWLTGLQVVDDRRGTPIGFARSIRRNLILLIPLMPIVLAFQMRGGPRWGEGWAGTRVVIRKRRAARAFSVTEDPSEDWSSSANEG
jgi:hypothetical protein